MFETINNEKKKQLKSQKDSKSIKKKLLNKIALIIVFNIKTYTVINRVFSKLKIFYTVRNAYNSLWHVESETPKTL